MEIKSRNDTKTSRFKYCSSLLESWRNESKIVEVEVFKDALHQNASMAYGVRSTVVYSEATLTSGN